MTRETSRTRGWSLEGAVQGAILAVLAYGALRLLQLQTALRFRPELHWWAAVLVGVLAGGLRRWRAPRVLLWVASGAMAALVLVVATTPLMRSLVRPYVRRDAAQPVDAVVALSGGMTSTGLVAEQSVERLLDGIRLARALDRPLVVTIMRTPGDAAVTSLADQRELATLGGVRELDAVGPAATTRDEAVRVSALMATRGWRRVALITSPVHTRRACAAFEHTGVVVQCVPARSREMVAEGPLALLSARERLYAFGVWLYEVAGWWSYRAHGWV